MIRVVDLGCKSGGSLQVFCSFHARREGLETGTIARGDCLGVDRAARYREAIERRGHLFDSGDVLHEDCWERLPAQAEFWLAWDFLEHLPDREASSGVLRRMLQRATRAVVLRMPSFEPWDVAELSRLGLRMTWTTWREHPSHYTLSDVRRTVAEIGGPDVLTVQVRGRRLTKTTACSWLVPLDAPFDAHAYDPRTHGDRPVVPLNPGVYPQWDVIVARRGTCPSFP